MEETTSISEASRSTTSTIPSGAPHPPRETETGPEDQLAASSATSRTSTATTAVRETTRCTLGRR